MKKLAHFLAIDKNIGVMLVTVVFIGLGEHMAERFLPLYILALGGSSIAIGLLNGMDNLLSALYSYPGGYFAEKFGYKRALLFFTAVAMLGYLIVILVEKWWAVLLGAVFFIAWTAVTLPAVMKLVFSSVDKNKRTMGVTLHSLIRRLPMAAGPVLGGIAIATFGKTMGIKIAFACAFVLGFVAMIFLWRFVEDTCTVKGDARKRKSIMGLIPPALRKLLVADILVRFAEQIPYAFVVVWAVNLRGITEVQFGVLSAIEMVTAIIIYIPVAYFADRFGKKPFVAITFAFFSFFPLLVMFAQSFWTFVIAFIVRGLKEFGEPTRKALIMDLAPDDSKAEAFGAYYLARDVVVSIAAFGGALLWQHSPQLNFFTAFAFGVAGTIFFILSRYQ